MLRTILRHNVIAHGIADLFKPRHIDRLVVLIQLAVFQFQLDKSQSARSAGIGLHRKDPLLFEQVQEEVFIFRNIRRTIHQIRKPPSALLVFDVDKIVRHRFLTAVAVENIFQGRLIQPLQKMIVQRMQHKVRIVRHIVFPVLFRQSVQCNAPREKSLFHCPLLLRLIRNGKSFFVVFQFLDEHLCPFVIHSQCSYFFEQYVVIRCHSLYTPLRSVSSYAAPQTSATCN